MAKELIGVDVEGAKETAAALQKVPKGLKSEAGEEVANYLLNVLKAYPPKKSVTRKSAYGRTFFSAKQRRWFFAALDSGSLKIPYRRTQGFRKAWRKIGKGDKSIVVNDSGVGPLLMGEIGQQSRHAKKIGWKSVSTVLREKKDQIMRKAQAGAKKGVKKTGFKI
jgi:hypothetical protein